MPPFAPRRAVTVVRHGESFTDNYAWLRDKADPSVREYLEAENAHADGVLHSTRPLQQQLYDEMLGRIKETDLSVPYSRDGWWYYSRTEEGKQYPIHCRRRSMEGGDEVILVDLNELSAGKEFMALGDMAVSDDGWLLAYSTDDTGFRQYTLVVKDLRSGEHLDFQRERVTSVAWDTDGRTLWYGVEDETTKRSWQVWKHVLGAGADELVFQEDDEAMNTGVHRSRSREWLMIHSASHTTSETLVKRTGSEDPWRVLIPRVPDIEYEVAHHGARFLVRINDTGRNFRLIQLPLDAASLAAASELVAHRDHVMIEGHECFADWRCERSPGQLSRAGVRVLRSRQSRISH
jgi:oligopeptidase B